MMKRVRVKKIRISEAYIREIIREELEANADAVPINVDRPDEVETEEDVWAGGENLVDPVDHQEKDTGHAVQQGIEIAPVVAGEDKVIEHIRYYLSKFND